MKKLNSIVACLKSKIKKYFFNSSKTDINHECEKLFNMNENTDSQEELNLAKEYVESYTVTTRWQTL
jgi:hypothetical protein